MLHSGEATSVLDLLTHQQMDPNPALPYFETADQLVHFAECWILLLINLLLINLTKQKST